MVDSPNSLGAQARLRRAERFVSTFPTLSDMTVLDLGGTKTFWERLSIRPRAVVALNPVAEALPEAEDGAPEHWYSHVEGDACDPPEDVATREFDLVFSNSTIEHVGDGARRAQFAAVVYDLADAHWIQTPNRAFPIEPHVLFPFEQFLPRYGKALVHRYWPLVHTNSANMESAVHATADTELLARDEMARLFPTSSIEEERVSRFLPAKSLIAIRLA